MKKVLSYILISLIISANLFAPFSVGWGKNKIEIQNSKAEAIGNDYDVDLQVKSTTTSDSITIDVSIVKGTGTKSVSISGGQIINTDLSIKTTLLDSTGKEIIKEDRKSIPFPFVDNNVISFSFPKLEEKTEYKITTSLINKVSQTQTTPYGANTIYNDDILITKGPISIPTIAKGETAVIKDQNALNVKANQNTPPDPATMPACIFASPMKGTFGGCMAQALYYMVFVPSSYLFAMSGIFFDSSFAYSVQDSSYRSAFVVQGWGLIRDFCNMFFIFIMLYIAIGTILNLSSVKTKETIINVVIIGLFINFSLFATQIIIDASNITARVFYNSNSIKITEKGVTGATNVVSKIGEGGVIPISAALVNKINPQNLILNAGKINDVSDTGGSSASDNSEQSQLVGKNGQTNSDFNSGNASFTAGTFALIVIMTSAVNIVGFVVFITVGFLFFARVIGLWLAMILAPLAFFTYIVPGMKDIKMIGWTKWWPETLKMAFLAPVFIFFMYLILKFLEMDLISDAQGKSGVAFFVAGMIPFVFIMIFMIKAKKIATDMSGEFGEMATKAGSAVGGMVLGGAVGMGAMAMRGTIGRLGSSIANSDRLKASEARGGVGGFFAKNLRNVGTAAGTGSFDARNTKAGSMAGSGMGVDMGKGKEGGFVKARADNVAYRQKRAKELERGEDSPETQAVRNAEHALHAAKTNAVTQNALVRLNNGEPDQAIANAAEANMNANPADAAAVAAFVDSRGLGGLERYVATRERAVSAAERALKDAVDAMAAIPSTVPVNDPTRIAAQNEITRLRTNRDAEILGGARADGTIVAIGRDQAKNNLENRQGAIRGLEGPIHTLENALKVAENNKIEVNNQIRHDYAHTIQGAWSNTINGIISLNEHSALGEREAANKILSGVQEAQKITEHH